MAGCTRHNGDALGSALREEHQFPELRAVARGIIRRTLRAHKGNRAAATRELGLGQNQLYQWLAKWPELDPDVLPASRGRRHR